MVGGFTLDSVSPSSTLADAQAQVTNSKGGSTLSSVNPPIATSLATRADISGSVVDKSHATRGPSAQSQPTRRRQASDGRAVVTSPVVSDPPHSDEHLLRAPAAAAAAVNVGETSLNFQLELLCSSPKSPRKRLSGSLSPPSNIASGISSYSNSPSTPNTQTTPLLWHRPSRR